VAGRIADKRGPNGIIDVGALLVLAGFILFAIFHTILGLSFGIILLVVPHGILKDGFVSPFWVWSLPQSHSL
jgi:hypothetical protein